MSEQLPLMKWSAFGKREAFWRIARCWLERGWWTEEHANGPYIGGAPRGKKR